MFGHARRFWFIPLFIILALGHVQPVAAQEILPGEANQWFADRVRSFKSEREAGKEATRLEGLGVKNVNVWVRPWLDARDDSFSYLVLVGPFSTEGKAQQAADDAKQRTGEFYIKTYRPGMYQDDKKNEVVYYAIGGDFASFDDGKSSVDKIKSFGFDAFLAGKFSPNGDFVWQSINRGYRVRANAEKMVAKMKAAGIASAYVQVVDWPYLDKLEDARIAAQTPRVPVKPSSDYEDRLLKWMQCEKQYSIAQPEKITSRCGYRPNF